MAQQLWILRHAEAEPHGDDDASRRLTDHGVEQARVAGRALAAIAAPIHAAFTSPRVRAHDTAALACASLALEAVVHEPLSGGFDRDDALALLGAAGPDRGVLIVGHEPDLSQLVHDLTGARISLKKAGLAVVRMDGTLGGTLLALLRPRELAQIADIA